MAETVKKKKRLGEISPVSEEAGTLRKQIETEERLEEEERKKREAEKLKEAAGRPAESQAAVRQKQAGAKADMEDQAREMTPAQLEAWKPASMGDQAIKSKEKRRRSMLGSNRPAHEAAAALGSRMK